MDFVRSCVVMTLILALGGFGLTACEQGDVPTIDPDAALPEPAPMDADPIEAPEPADTEPATAEAEDIALVEAEVEEEVLWDSGLLQNGSFEEWEGGRPVGWNIQGGGPVQTSDSITGDFAIEFPDVEDTWPMVLQSISNVEPFDTITFGAQVFAEDPDKAVVQIRYNRDGEQINRSSTHPGTGDWVSIETTIELPDDFDTNSLSIRIFRRPDTEGRVMVDDAFLTVN